MARPARSRPVSDAAAAPAGSAVADAPIPAAERAAIIEHDGDIPRAWAEGFARLDPEQPPGEVPPRRWQRFVDDAGRFLDSPFCAVAAPLGWGPFDLFGCDRDRPFARLDQSGLLWLLAGDKLVALSENTATIEAATGVRQTWRRKRAEPGRVLAWELPGSISKGAFLNWSWIETHERPTEGPTEDRWTQARDAKQAHS